MTAAGPGTTVATAQGTVHGFRAAPARPPQGLLPTARSAPSARSARSVHSARSARSGEFVRSGGFVRLLPLIACLSVGPVDAPPSV